MAQVNALHILCDLSAYSIHHRSTLSPDGPFTSFFLFCVPLCPIAPPSLSVSLCPLSGKTTTINMLTGLYEQTFGEAYICGFSTREDIAHIQSIIGVCTQDNLLWDQLTVLQTVRLMAAIRNVIPSVIPTVVENRLQLVNLWPHRNKKACELSGGMKRRLAIALAMIGDPKVLFLDEPTTGLDPVHRNEVWEAIRAIKVNRVVCLTSHAMDEVDHLGDRIALLAAGRLRALGSSLYLKNHYGKGYQLQLLVSPADVPQLIKAVEQYLSGSSIVGKEAGAVTVALKRSQLKNVPLLFKWIEGTLSMDVGHVGKGLLREWSISNSTLEEVFLRLCAADTTVNAEIEGLGQREEEEAKCVVCHVRPPNVVTLYTAGGIPVVLPNVMCVPCSMGPALAEEKAKEDERLRLAESKEGEEDSGERIQWTLDESRGGAPPPPGSQVGGMMEGVSPLSPPPSESIQSSVGKVAPTLRQQVRSIMLKDAAMAWTEKKGWCARLCVLIVMIALVVVFAALATLGTYTQLCPQGYTTYGRPCDDATMQAYLFSGGNSLDSYLSNSNGSWIEPQGWLRCSNSGCYNGGWFLGSNSLGPTVAVVQQPGGQGFLSYDMGWGVGGFNATTRPPPLQYSNYPTFIDWTPLLQSTGLDVTGQMTANEQLVQSRYSSAPSGNCYGFPAAYWLNANSSATALAQVQFTYPDHVLSVQQQKASGAGDSLLSYQLSTYTSESARLPSMGYNSNTVGCYYWNFAVYRNYLFSTWRYMIHGLSHSLLYTSLRQHSSYTQGKGGDVWRNASAPGIQGNILSVTSLTFYPSMVDPVVGLIAAFVMFPSLLLLPWFADRILYEREEDLHHMMRIAGLRTSSYWSAPHPTHSPLPPCPLSPPTCHLLTVSPPLIPNSLCSAVHRLGNYLFDTLISWVWCAALIITGLASGAQIFQASPFLWILLYLVWIHSQLGVAWFLTLFFKRRRVASVFMYLLVMSISAAAWGYGAFGYTNITWAWYFNLFPPLTFMRALTALIRYQPSVAQAMAVGSEFANALNACLWMGTVYLLAAVLLNTLRYQTLDQVLSSVPWYRERMQKRKEEEEQKDAGDERISAAFLPIVPDHPSGEDEDVQLERQRVIERQNRSDTQPAISILNLKKSFNADGWRHRLYSAVASRFMSEEARASASKKVVNAVQGLYLGMENGDVFGLLGPNGAGKSTTLSILSGLYHPSSGRALIAGHDVETDLGAVYTVLGICPQADRVWDDLTIQQHLTFYARLKGVDRLHESALVQRIAEMVSLDGDSFGKAASTLSGGTRRRLAIAISLIGNPSVWLLDEPTTGLSPEARREVWDIISKQKAVSPSTHHFPLILRGRPCVASSSSHLHLVSVPAGCVVSCCVVRSLYHHHVALNGRNRHALHPHRHRLRREAAGRGQSGAAEAEVR